MMTTKTATIKREFSNPLEHDLMKMEYTKVLEQDMTRMGMTRMGMTRMGMTRMGIGSMMKSIIIWKQNFPQEDIIEMELTNF
jgi:hypothetical protein